MDENGQMCGRCYVKIYHPPGTTSGKQLRLVKQGGPGIGGAPGVIYIWRLMCKITRYLVYRAIISN